MVESLDNESRVGLAGCLFLGLGVAALALTFLSVMGRPDSAEEVIGGRFVDLLVVGPLWAIVAFVASRCRGRTKLRASVVALILYVVVVSSLLALNTWKVNMRSAAADRTRSQQVVEPPTPPAR